MMQSNSERRIRCRSIPHRLYVSTKPTPFRDSHNNHFGLSSNGLALTALVIADRFGAYNVTIVANLAMVILFYAWLAAKTGTSLIVISILYGIASGAFVSLQAPMITKLADDMRFAGTMVGQVLSAYLP